MTKSGQYKYAFQLTLDKDLVAVVDKVISSGMGVNFSDAVRYCIREEQKRQQERQEQKRAKP